MSEGIPLFNQTNFLGFSNSSFVPTMSSGFTLGGLDRANNTGFKSPLSSKMNDISANPNRENKENEGKKKKFQKNQNKRKGTDELFPEHMMKSNESSNQINQEDGEENSQDNQLCKASKKIRKQTIDRLKKRIEKQQPEHVKQSMMKHKHMNKRNGMRNYAPGKGIKTNNRPLKFK